ncbi:pyridoxal-phosphate dependent enzyme [Vulcanisaeta souniana]|uniref:pyridoxal-phosphate dependent enzyme n=1 Tax=Vulcanisaeta souniana TaxID=164452 RepID=UPI001FB56769|nr:pyridoxal-phosphate dependent enzyme [Vulcanisaeta souniana]
MFSLSDVYRARQVISRYLLRTPPLVYSRQLSRLLDFDVYLKLENLQPTRAFKVRGGGVYFVMVRRDEAQRRGLIAASTG